MLVPAPTSAIWRPPSDSSRSMRARLSADRKTNRVCKSCTCRSPELPFFYVLLAAGHTAMMREAQVQGAGAIARTAFASALDLGAEGSEFLVPGHPPRKQEVGRRMSLLIRQLVRNETGFDVTGPRVKESGVTVTKGATSTTVLIPFDVGLNGALHLNATGGCRCHPITSIDVDLHLAHALWFLFSCVRKLDVGTSIKCSQ